MEGHYITTIVLIVIYTIVFTKQIREWWTKRKYRIRYGRR